MKYTRHIINIYFKDLNEKRVFQNQIKTRGVQYFTYTERLDKTNAYVLRGPVAEEVLNELRAMNPSIQQVYRMNNRAANEPVQEHDYRPVNYLVVTGNQVK